MFVTRLSRPSGQFAYTLSLSPHRMCKTSVEYKSNTSVVKCFATAQFLRNQNSLKKSISFCIEILPITRDVYFLKYMSTFDF